MTTMITQSDEWKYWDNLQISIHQNSGFSDITLKWDTNEGLWVESQTLKIFQCCSVVLQKANYGAPSKMYKTTVINQTSKQNYHN